MKKIILLISNIVHSILYKKEIVKVEFLLNGSWKPEQWKKRDLLLSQGYTLLEHSWGEFDNYSTYIYSKEVKSNKYYVLTLNFFKIK